MLSERPLYKIGGIAAIVGIVVLLVATFAHPMSEDPSDEFTAFAEYAADPYWVASHLGQLLGVAFFTGGLVSLSWRLRSGRAGVWALLGGIVATASLALSGALQAVDGIALKVMVDRWIEASPEEQALLFEGAFVVRQVEIGLASIALLFFGLTGILYACALWFSDQAANWLSGVAMASGCAMLIAGIMYAYTGFSEMAMMVSMPASLLLAVWGIGVGVYLLRSSVPKLKG